MNRPRTTHLSFQGGDRTQYRGETVSPRSGAFKAKFLVQRLEQLKDGEVESSLQGHDGDCRSGVVAGNVIQYSLTWEPTKCNTMNADHDVVRDFLPL